MSKHSIILVAAFTASLALGACADHYSTQEAYVTCEDLAARLLTSSDDSFADCVDCHERCGADCARQNGALPPDEYVCPEDLGE